VCGSHARPGRPAAIPWPASPAHEKAQRTPTNREASAGLIAPSGSGGSGPAEAAGQGQDRRSDDQLGRLPSAIGVGVPLDVSAPIGIAYQAGRIGGYDWEDDRDLGPVEIVWRLVVGKEEIEGPVWSMTSLPSRIESPPALPTPPRYPYRSSRSDTRAK
jgi:hypothetical protein